MQTLAPAIRKTLVTIQHRFGEATNAVFEGRDMGTVVFPDAAVKIFLTASPEIRARRRTAELLERGQQADYETILADINQRDANDSGRVHAPLKPAADARHLDTSEMDVDEVVETIAALASRIA